MIAGFNQTESDHVYVPNALIPPTKTLDGLSYFEVFAILGGIVLIVVVAVVILVTQKGRRPPEAPTNVAPSDPPSSS